MPSMPAHALILVYLQPTIYRQLNSDQCFPWRVYNHNAPCLIDCDYLDVFNKEPIAFCSFLQYLIKYHVIFMLYIKIKRQTI